MRFLCEHLPVEDIGLHDDPDAPEVYEVERDECQDCSDYETCKEDEYLKEVDEKLRLLSTQAKEGKEEERVEQKLAENDRDHAYFQNLVSFPKTPERAALSNKAKLWVHRLQQGGEKRRIELSSKQAAEIADLLGLIPKLLEAQAIAEIGVKQADRFDEAAGAYFVNEKSIPGLRKSARVLGWNTGKKEPQFPDDLFLYEYISLIERKYGGTTEGKKSAAEEMRNRMASRVMKQPFSD